VACVSEVLGLPDQTWLERSPRREKYFDAQGTSCDTVFCDERCVELNMYKCVMALTKTTAVGWLVFRSSRRPSCLRSFTAFYCAYAALTPFHAL
jgi:hypothetical protein